MHLYFVDNRTYYCKCTATDVIRILTKWAEDVQVDYLTNTDGNTQLSSKKNCSPKEQLTNSENPRI